MRIVSISYKIFGERQSAQSAHTLQQAQRLLACLSDGRVLPVDAYSAHAHPRYLFVSLQPLWQAEY